MAAKTTSKPVSSESDDIRLVSSVSSRNAQSPRTVTFTVPQFQRPTFQRPDQARLRAGMLAFAFILIAVIAGFGGSLIENRNSSGLINTSLSGQKKIVTSQSQLISQIAKTVGPSVVSINDVITSTSSSDDSDDGFGLYGFSQPEEEEAAGTGIIISSGGYIVTNRHVVPDGTTDVSVTLSDGTELKDVTVVGRTSTTDSLDLAILKINNAMGHKLVPAAIGDSSQVTVGDNVVAIGNALGQFQNTVTSGIISGYGRSVQASSDTSGDSSDGSGDDGSSDTSSADSENLDDLFQTDAAINEGNSGGPLVNLNGQVIGINTAVASDSQNIGFAIPINDAKGLINQVLRTGKFQVPYLGVRYIPLTADVAKEYGLSVTNGAFIAPSTDSTEPSVVSGSPADTAGVKVSDVITQINGTSIDSSHSLTSLLDQHSVGDSVTLTIVRGSQMIKLNVTLGIAPTS
jgi:serine protease Do